MAYKDSRLFSQLSIISTSFHSLNSNKHFMPLSIHGCLRHIYYFNLPIYTHPKLNSWCIHRIDFLYAGGQAAFFVRLRDVRAGKCWPLLVVESDGAVTAASRHNCFHSRVPLQSMLCSTLQIEFAPQLKVWRKNWQKYPPYI